MYASSQCTGLYDCRSYITLGIPGHCLAICYRLKLHCFLNVLPDEPSVLIAEELIHSGPGQRVTIKCTFSANPKVDVTWKHNGSDIDFGFRSNFHLSMLSELGSELYQISIDNMKPTDFGEYSCKGVNSLGEAEGRVTVSGTRRKSFNPTKCTLAHELIDFPIQTIDLSLQLFPTAYSLPVTLQAFTVTNTHCAGMSTL